MTLFNIPFLYPSHKSSSIPVVTTNLSIGSWCYKLHTQPEPARFVRKVELCTALASGQDAWGDPVDESHLHTVLRVSLVPTHSTPGGEEDVVLIERVLCTGGAYHSVTPISEAFSTRGTLFHPDVHDRICVISEGSSDAVAHRLKVERTLEFGGGPSNPCLTLIDFARILELISRTTAFICAGGDCKFQSRSFAFTCMAAVMPCLLPPKIVHERVCTNLDVKFGADLVDDAVFEDGAMVFLAQFLPQMVRDPASMETLKLMLALRVDLEH